MPDESYNSLLTEFLGSQNLRALPADIAKLYSQHVRRRHAQPSLRGWDDTTWRSHWESALRLADAALGAEEVGLSEGNEGLRRAAEIFEWLTDAGCESVEIDEVLLIAAACYQVAGYPARASGVIKAARPLKQEVWLAEAYLQGNFPELFHRVRDHWSEFTGVGARDGETELESRAHPGILRSLGVVCAHMRWGDSRVGEAAQKLSHFSAVMQHRRDDSSWLLARLFARIAQVYSNSGLRTVVTGLRAHGDTSAN